MAFSWHYKAFSTITFVEPESETLQDRNNSKDIFSTNSKFIAGNLRLWAVCLTAHGKWNFFRNVILSQNT